MKIKSFKNLNVLWKGVNVEFYNTESGASGLRNLNNNYAI